MPLHPLPIRTFGDVAGLGPVLRVRCSRCGTSRRVEITDALRDRPVFGQRFACSAVRWDGSTCGGPGQPIVEPSPRPRIDDSLDHELYFLDCTGCVPPWEIAAIDIRRAPWSEIAAWRPGDRYRCPACGGRVGWQVHGRPWRPK